jgi:tetratricopeptide (TPR) repeat protein
MEFHDKALKIYLTTLGENHPSTATSYNNIAIVYYNMEKYQDAYDLMGKALKIREMSLPSTHSNLIQSKNSLATIKEKLNAH